MIVNSSKPVRLFFIRHGQTEWSLSGQYTGRADLPLTPRGEDEARGLLPWIRRIQFAHVLTSPRRRALRTCELNGLGAAAEIDEDLAEWDYGEFEGLQPDDVRKRLPNWEIFRDGCPGGEAPAQISDRADRLIGRLRALTGNIALFSHGEFGRVLAARWIEAPAATGRHFAIATASVGILGYQSNHPNTPVLALWNATPTTLLDYQ